MKNYSLHRTTALCSASLLTLGMLYAAPALANPQGGTVAAGSATISESGTKLDINQHTNRIVIDWRSFDIDVNEHTQFHQPSSNAVALNRVNSRDPSRIAGELSANGNIILINPNGVFFEGSSRVDVNGLIATTADIDNADFMDGKLKFNQPGNSNAAIVNAGHITAKEAGLVALVAPSVSNHGIIEAKLGRVELASGDSFMADLYGDGLYELKVSDEVASQLVSNTGAITAEGGTIAMTASTGSHIVNSLVSIAGELSAPTISQKGGKIIIGAATNNNVQVSGNVTANNIRVRGEDITLTDTATLIATRANKASSTAPRITVGGEYLGGDGIGNAQRVTVAEGATLKAGNAGQPGEVIVWSDDITRFDGYAEANFVETSGKVTLKIGDTARVQTHGGLWLLDPQNFTIADNGGDISTATLQTNLGFGDVSILSSGGASAGDGDIIIADAFGWNANRLTLTAARDVLVNNVVTVSGTGALTVNTATSNGGDVGVADGALKVGLGPTGFSGRVDYDSSGSLIINGNTYQVINSLGAAGSTTGTDLQGINGDLSGHYVLGSNIDASATIGWNAGRGFDPIGGIFTGSFNGLGHTIDNLYIDNFAGTDRRALFERTNSAALSNVGITNLTIASGRNFIGALVGWMSGDSVVRNSYSTGSINGGGLTGGLVGYMFGDNDRIIDSYSNVNIATTSQQVGGLVGDSNGTNIISGSYATGNVSSPTAQLIGGLVGLNRNGSRIIDSYATGTVTALSSAGGLVGSTSGNASISNSYATGDVNATSSNIGGLAGSNITNSSISNSYATGDVRTNSVVVGGLVGFNFNGSSITDSYATGSTTGTVQVGGLVGHNQNSSTIANSYATGVTTGERQVGGLVGENRNNSTISVSYATGNVIGTGSGLTGGLVGLNRTAAITNSYATGNVNSVGADAGGLVGQNLSGASVVNSFATGTVSGTNTGGLIGVSAGAATTTNSFWNTTTSGQTTSAGGTGITNAQFTQTSTFASAGWDITDTGGGATIWRIYEGNTGPLLANFLTDLTLTSNTTKTYDALGFAAGDAVVTGTGFRSGESVADLLGSPNIGGTAAGAVNAGNYTLLLSGYASGQQGYDINYTAGSLTINQANLTVTANDASREQGSANPTLTGSIAGFAGGETIANLMTAPTYSTLADLNSDVGTFAITASGGAATNYSFTYIDGTLTINPQAVSNLNIPNTVQIVSQNPIVMAGHTPAFNNSGSADLGDANSIASDAAAPTLSDQSSSQETASNEVGNKDANISNKNLPAPKTVLSGLVTIAPALVELFGLEKSNNLF